MIGTRLGHYEITERIGEGGMGVVWKATDMTLGRSVAIKVLPELLARDPERLARLEREARLLAALSHPNIASIYGLHEEGGVRFLAMELAPGENLAARMARGPLAIDEALAIALRIAEALEHAHENGIVHRDLKPANVVIGQDGAVKVLDFGLAKAFETEQASGSGPSLTQSPTITAGMTAANVVLGTAAYMSPEQARGQAADKRADIWSFGVVLYEMLTGARMFEGETVSDVLAAVLRADFEWRRLPEGLSPRVRALLERCLARDRRARLRDIGEARIMLAAEVSGEPDPYSGAADTTPGAARWAASRGGWAWPAGVGALALLAGLLAGRGLWRGPDPGDQTVPHRKFRLRTTAGLDRPQISHDGRRVAWLEGDTLLVQELDSTEPRHIALPARARPSDLFWAPDGNELGYVSGSTVHAIDLRTRASRQICDTRGPFTSGSGATWGDDGIITMTRAETDGLLQVPAVGGDPRVVLPSDSLISDYHDPFALPGGRGVLCVAHTRTGPLDEIHVFDGRTARRLLKVDGHLLFDPVYASSGHILFERSRPSPGVWAVPFSLEKLEVTGEPFLVAPESAAPSVARDGTLIFVLGQTEALCDLLLADADGTVRSTIMRFAATGAVVPALSPDGRRVVVPVQGEDGSDLWVCDIQRGTRTRLTFTGGTASSPVWTPDGRAIVYQVRGAGGSGWTLFLQAADGSGGPDTLAHGAYLAGVTPDGRSILYTRGEDEALCLQPLDGGDVTPTGIMGQAKPAVSPDGRFIAYVSAETGRNEVYLRRFPSFTGKWQVSTTGGDWPLWNARGDRIYFARDNDVMAVDIDAADTAVLGVPRRLFTRSQMSARGIAGWSARFGINADGSLFVFGVDVDIGASQNTLVLDQNWFAPFAQRPR